MESTKAELIKLKVGEWKTRQVTTEENIIEKAAMFILILLIKKLL